MFRSVMVGLAAGAVIGLSACASRQDSIQAALALAEANYPGQLELESAHLRSDYYEVTFLVHGDEFSRVRFAVDRDPANCRAETRCETRLKTAYEIGREAGVKLRAVDQAFRSCGVPALAVYDAQISPGLRTVVELAMDPRDPQPGLDRLTPCILAFRSALPPGAGEPMSSLALVIVEPSERGATPMPPALAFDTRIEDRRLNAPSFMVTVPANVDRVTPDRLTLNGHFPRRGLNDALASEARRILRAEAPDAHVPQMTFPEIKLDSDRLDVVHAYVLACSVRVPNAGPCRTDMAVRLRYDFSDGQVSQTEVLRDVRGARGDLNLPPLPGR